MAGVKRKLASYCMKTKYQAVMEVEKGSKSKTDIAKQFGIPTNTLSTWLKSADRIKSSYAEGGPVRKRLRMSQYPDLEDAMLMWFKDARSRKIPLSGPILQSRAVKLATDLGYTNFKCSDGWLSRFKARHEINFKALGAKSARVESSQTDLWTTETLPNILAELMRRATTVGVAFEEKFEEIAADDNTMATVPLKDTVIVESVTQKHSTIPADPIPQADSDDDPLPIKLTPSATLDHCSIIKGFLKMQDDSNEAFLHLKKLERYIASKKVVDEANYFRKTLC